MKFRKKPRWPAYHHEEVDAFRIGIDSQTDWFQTAVADCVITTYVVEKPDDNNVSTWCNILTSKGTVKGDHGDYIVQGVHKEIYPCKPDIFLLTYEPAE